MTTIQIDLPDEQVAALKAKLSEQGLSVEEWVKNLVEAEAPRRTPGSAQEAVARILELQKHVRPDPEGWTVKDYINHGRP
jgi:hypothetical protein